MIRFVINQEYVCPDCGYEDSADMIEGHLIEAHAYTGEQVEIRMSYIIRDAEEGFDGRRDAWGKGD